MIYLINQGASVGIAALQCAKLAFRQVKGESGHTYEKRLAKQAANIERRFREAQTELLQPWSHIVPERPDVKLGPFLFHGRPVPKPIALVLRREVRAGRPPKGST